LAGVAWVFTSPPNTFNPLCTYDLSYRFSATIEVANKRYSSEVVHQMARPRDWISDLNRAGCGSLHGTALPFRLDDDRVVLLRARVCPAAINALTGVKPRERGMKKPDYSGAMREQRSVNVADHCAGIAQDAISHAYVKVTDGFLIDNANAPSQWEGLFLDRATASSNTNVHLVSAKAQALIRIRAMKWIALRQPSYAQLSQPARTTGGTVPKPSFRFSADTATRVSSSRQRRGPNEPIDADGRRLPRQRLAEACHRHG
jgi:hypothetical protein